MQKYIFLRYLANKNDKTLSKNDIFNVCKHKQRSIIFKKKRMERNTYVVVFNT